MKNNNTTSSGLGFTGFLQVAFIVLKLCKVIKWSWLWVLSPAWVGFILFVVLVFVFAYLINKK